MVCSFGSLLDVYVFIGDVKCKALKENSFLADTLCYLCFFNDHEYADSVSFIYEFDNESVCELFN